MFPYPSGSGLHVGHPLGYIASDVYARYMRHKGYNVLHPMGYDSFGLPAEQYAIQTGQHPAITTDNNVARYRQQLDQMGFLMIGAEKFVHQVQSIIVGRNGFSNSYLMLITARMADQARPISELYDYFSQEGNGSLNACCDEDTPSFSAVEWNACSEEEQQALLMKYRMSYLSDTWVNWCEKLGTVLANDEVKDGVSERGGHPVEQKLMRQWSMRITAYAERLLNDLETVDWSDSSKRYNAIGLVNLKVLQYLF